MGIISLEQINIDQNRIEYRYQVSEDLKSFFLHTPYFMEYWLDDSPLDLSRVPKSILAVPFCCNILPICWIADAELIVSEIDRDFAESIPAIKAGYAGMYPNIKWGGKECFQSIITNRPVSGGRSAVLFSGGVDSWCTLIRHIEEKPDLITIWGSDIEWDNEKGWERLHQSIKNSAEQMGLSRITVRSTFRKVIYEDCLTWTYEKVLGDNWWHGIQHGIAINSHTAACNYLRGCTTQYIAASASREYGKAKIASYPTIDGALRFGQCDVRHDAFISRQRKIEEIRQFCEEENTQIHLHVCWEKTDGRNCCHCEKCMRTIAGLKAAGCDPSMYGFDERKYSYSTIEKVFMREYQFLPETERRWKPIRDRLRETGRGEDQGDLYWLREYNFPNEKRNIVNRIQNVIADSKNNMDIEYDHSQTKNRESCFIKNIITLRQAVLYFLLFTALMVFFIKIHPLVVWDVDDWLYISYTRVPWPSVTEWNPARVFPEVFMPLCGLISSKVVYPFTGDYIGSFSVVLGFAVSVSIVIYTKVVVDLVKKYSKINFPGEVTVSFLFIILHFLIFRIQETENVHLFFNNDATCYFYYTIPAILNFSLVIYFDRTKGHKKSILIPVLVYFAIFSNLFTSYILAIYSAVRVLEEIFESGSIRISSKVLRRCVGNLTILLLWFISMWYELQGKRAASFGQISIKEKIDEAFSGFVRMNTHLNGIFFLLLCLSTFVMMAVTIVKLKRKECIRSTIAGLFLKTLLISPLYAAYLILLCTVTNPGYSGRPEIVIGFWMLPITLIAVTAGMLIMWSRKMHALLILILMISFFSINSRGRVFRECIIYNIDPLICRQISTDMVDQVLKAEESGENTVELHVPMFNRDKNWPLAEYGADRIADSMYKHGILKRHINSIFVIDPTINQKYHLEQFLD